MKRMTKDSCVTRLVRRVLRKIPWMSADQYLEMDNEIIALKEYNRTLVYDMKNLLDALKPASRFYVETEHDYSYQGVAVRVRVEYEPIHMTSHISMECLRSLEYEDWLEDWSKAQAEIMAESITASIKQETLKLIGTAK